MFTKKGSDLNSKEPEGFTPFHAASGSGHISIVNYLISNGVDVNSKGNEGITLLHITYSKNAEVTDGLIKS